MEGIKITSAQEWIENQTKNALSSAKQELKEALTIGKNINEISNNVLVEYLETHKHLPKNPADVCFFQIALHKLGLNPGNPDGLYRSTS